MFGVTSWEVYNGPPTDRALTPVANHLAETMPENVVHLKPIGIGKNRECCTTLPSSVPHSQSIISIVIRQAIREHGEWVGVGDGKRP